MTYTLARSILTLSLLGALAGSSFAQFPGGGGGGGRGGDRGGMGGGRGGGGGGAPDPDMIWNMMSQGKDSINLNDPSNARIRDRMAQQGQAIPPNGILTKTEFRGNFEKQMASGGFGGRGGRGGDRGGMGGAQTMTMTPGPNGQMMMSTNGGPAVAVQGNPAMMTPTMGGTGGDRGGRGGGFDPTGMTDDQIKSMMARNYELDPAGRISMMAAQSGRGSLKDSFTQFDTNRDGFVDSNEYRGVLLARMNGGGNNGMNGGMNNGMNNFQPGMNSPQGWGGSNGMGGMPGGGVPERGRRGGGDDEEAKPVVYRFGNLPKEVPSWFEQQDTDKDGQIGLYEWRAAKKSLSEFEEYDLNGDGYVTAEEWLRKQRSDLAKREEEERMSKPAGTTSTTGGRSSFGGGRGGPGGGGPGGGGDRTSAPSSGRNPFTGAGGPPGGGGDRGGRGGPPGGNGGGGDRGGRGGGPGGGAPGGRGGRGGDRGEEAASFEVKMSKEDKKAQKDNRNPKD